MNRRSFLRTSASAVTLLAFRVPFAGAAEAGFAPNAFLRIGREGGIVVQVCQSEMGQGIGTGLAMALAEELGTPLEDVRIEFATGRPEYRNRSLSPQEQITGGSRSMQAFFDAYRQAGAAAREMLKSAAARSWNVRPEACLVEKGRVLHPPSGRSAAYAQLASLAKNVPVPADPPLKSRGDYRLIGTQAKRLDLRSHCDGSAVFGTDVKLPRMVYAAVRHSPVYGAEVTGFDPEPAKDIQGVIDIVVLPGALAVVAEQYWQAVSALDRIGITFGPTSRDGGSSAALATALTAAFAFDSSPVAADTGRVGERIAAAPRRLAAEYRVPYLAHATLEPINATAAFENNRCTVWAPTQAPTRAQHAVAEALGLDRSAVQIQLTQLGGGFGAKGRTDAAVQAALLSRKVRRPVKLIWSREDDMRQDHYRPAYAARLEAGLETDGRPSALRVRIAGSGPLAFARPDLIRDGVDPVSTRDLVDLWYDIDGRRVETVEVEPPVRVGFWRGTGATQNVFFVESFIDEAAHAAGADPLAFRRGLLSHDARSAAVLELAARAAEWGTPLQAGRARGVAFFASPRWKCRVALVVETAQNGDRLAPVRMVCAADIGLAVNPDIVRAQLEGGIVFGLSAALYGEITVERGAVKQGNFDDYPVLRIDETPRIETHLIEGSDDPGSAGEIGVPAVAPALANAVFAATGRRIRALPLKL